MKKPLRVISLAMGGTLAVTALGIGFTFAIPGGGPTRNFGLSTRGDVVHPGPTADEFLIEMAVEEGAAQMGMGVQEFKDYSHGLETLDAVEASVGSEQGFYEMRLDQTAKKVELLWLEGEAAPTNLDDYEYGGYSIDIRRVRITPAVQNWIEGKDHSPSRGRASSIGYDEVKGGFLVGVVPGDTEFYTPASEMQEALDLPAEVVEVTINLDGGGPLSRRSVGVGSNPDMPTTTETASFHASV